MSLGKDLIFPPPFSIFLHAWQYLTTYLKYSTQNFLKFLCKNYVEKNNIHPLRTITKYIPHSYLHNYSYIQYFYTNFTTFSNILSSPTHTNFKTPHLGNIHTTTSHRDTKNIHTDFYIHNHNYFFTFLRQKIKLHLILNNLSQKKYNSDQY